MSAADRASDRSRLLGTLADLADSGRPIPCRTAPPEVAACWTSDDEDQQAYAARLCVGCAGRIGCEAYGLTYPREWGVYGARTNSERQPKRGRPPKTTGVQA